MYYKRLVEHRDRDEDDFYCVMGNLCINMYDLVKHDNVKRK